MKYHFKIAYLALIFSLTACAATQPQIKMQQAQNIREEIVESYPEQRPKWMEQPPVSDGKYDYFVGHSVKFSTEPAARDEAMSNAIKQFVRFCGVEVSIFDKYLKETTGRTSTVLAGVLSKREHEQQQAQAYVTSIKPKQWYLRRVRIFHDETPIDTGWKASVVIMVPVEEKARVQEYAKKTKQDKQAKVQEKHKADIGRLKDTLQPAADYYLQARELAQKGKVFQALKLLAEAQDIVDQHKDKPFFLEAKQAVQQKVGEKAIDQVSILQESLLAGIALIKVDGDGQRITPGEKLPKPLSVKAICNYGDEEILITPAEIEFRLDGQAIEKTSVNQEGIAQLAHYTFDDKYYGNIKIIARLKAEVQKEVYFNLFIDKPVVQQEEKLAMEVNFIYEDKGVPKLMWDGMSLRSLVDYYYAYFSPKQDCYVYIYQVDSAGAVYQIFPNLEYSNAWNPVKKGKDYWVPANDRLYLDDVTGEEKIYLFATKEPAAELERLFAQLSQTHNQWERESIQQQIKGYMYTRGIGGTVQGNPHPVIAKSGDTFQIISQMIKSVGPEFMYCLTFRHIPATQAVYQPISVPAFTTTTTKRKPKVILALGGGGVHGMAHVGVIRVLEEAGIPIDMIVGTSVGSLVGAIYAANPNSLDLEDVAFQIQKEDIFDFSITSAITGKSLAKGERLEAFIKEKVPVKRIEELKIPYAAVATDINTGDIVVLTHGSIAQAVRASCAHPIYFQPVSYNGRLLVDGGIAESVPVSTAHKLGADIVIAVDVGESLDENPEGLIEVLAQTKKILVNKTLKYSLKESDIVIKPVMGDLDFMDFSPKQKAECRRAGIEATQKAVPIIRDKIKAWAESQTAAIPIAF